MTAREKFRQFWIGRGGKIVLWLWARMSRIITVGHEGYVRLRQEGKPVILMIWHGRILLVPFYFRRKGIYALVSPSRDGEIPAQAMQRWGYRIIRGSGSHTIVGAWKKMVGALKEGNELIIIPDGPRGPNRIMKSGAIRLALETGASLVPVTFSSSKKKFLDSWDQFLLYPPLSRVVALFGEPVAVKPGLTEEDIETLRRDMERKMRELDKKADKYFDKNPD